MRARSPYLWLLLAAAARSSSQDCQRCPSVRRAPRGTIALAALAPDDASARALAAQCADEAVRTARDSAPFEPFYGQARAAAQQRVFHLTAKRASFSDSNLPMLPRTGWLAGSREGRRCAVVGSSGSLLRQAAGAEIDAHDIVLRINIAPTDRFERHAGSRTTLDLFWPHETHHEKFARREAVATGPPPLGVLVADDYGPSLTAFFRAQRERQQRAQNGSSAGRQPPPFYLASDQLTDRAVGALCDAADGGATWPTQTTEMRPSTGLLAAVLAQQVCSAVSLYGFDDVTDCEPHHYWGSVPAAAAACTNQTRLSSSVQGVCNCHSLETEHRILREWVAQGRLKSVA